MRSGIWPINTPDWIHRRQSSLNHADHEGTLMSLVLNSPSRADPWKTGDGFLLSM